MKKIKEIQEDKYTHHGVSVTFQESLAMCKCVEPTGIHDIKCRLLNLFVKTKP